MSPPQVRVPAHAGSFYAGTEDTLRKQIEWCFTHKLGPGKLPKASKKPMKSIVAVVCPHAGYVYSGPIAAHAYNALASDGTPDVIVAVGPNHTGYGSAVAMMSEGIWRTPLGDVEIDSDTASRISRYATIIDIDPSAHAYEHSIEVQLPFLQYVYGQSFRFVPICLRMQDLATTKDVGKAVAKALSGTNSIVLATSDLTHYEPQEVANEKDGLVIEAITKLDERDTMAVVESRRVSVCGVGPISAAIIASKDLGAGKAELLSYKTSGDITGDQSSVVGYSSFKMFR